MRRILLLSVSLLLAPQSLFVAAPASAASAAAADQSRTGEQCQRRNAGRRRAGSALGALGRGVLGHFGGSSVANAILPMGSMLGDAVMRLLDCDEQNKAANATEEAVRGGDVGDSASWQSDTRPGVTGTSTVTAVDHSGGGGDCLTVTDVIIVDGEETRAPKQMCRRPPSNRYVRV